MGFIQEARMLLEAAEKAAGSQPLRVGYLTLAKDTISAALTEAKKGVKAQDGHMPGQTSLEDFQTSASATSDEGAKGEVPADDEIKAEPTVGQFYVPELPSEADYDAALNAHDRPDNDEDTIPSIGDSRGIPTEQHA